MFRVPVSLSFVANLCLAQKFDFDPNGGDFQGKFCPPYRCPKGQEPVRYATNHNPPFWVFRKEI